MSKVFAYVRCSVDKQNESRQLDSLNGLDIKIGEVTNQEFEILTINIKNIQDFKSDLLKDNSIKSGTKNNKLRNWKKFFQWLIMTGGYNNIAKEMVEYLNLVGASFKALSNVKSTWIIQRQ